MQHDVAEKMLAVVDDVQSVCCVCDYVPFKLYLLSELFDNSVAITEGCFLSFCVSQKEVESISGHFQDCASFCVLYIFICVTLRMYFQFLIYINNVKINVISNIAVRKMHELCRSPFSPEYLLEFLASGSLRPLVLAKGGCGVTTIL